MFGLLGFVLKTEHRCTLKSNYSIQDKLRQIWAKNYLKVWKTIEL